LIVVVVAVVAAAGLAWMVWAIRFHTNPLVQSQLLSYRQPGEHSIVAQVTVVRSTAAVRATCVMQAMAADHAVVGQLNFTVGSSSPKTVTLRKAVRTERRAVTVDLMGCTAPGQKQPR
jgi:hypothetical protein